MKFAIALLMIQESQAGDELTYNFEQLITLVDAESLVIAEAMARGSVAVVDRTLRGYGVANVVGLPIDEPTLLEGERQNDDGAAGTGLLAANAASTCDT